MMRRSAVWAGYVPWTGAGTGETTGAAAVVAAFVVEVVLLEVVEAYVAKGCPPADKDPSELQLYSVLS